MKLERLCTRLDEELRIADYAPIDGSPNGLQVDRRDEDVAHVAVAVDAAAATIDAAIDAEADLLVTHHGLWWEGTERLTGHTFDRVSRLLAGDLGLYVAHLPLDGHQELGNAAGVASVLGLLDREPFGHIEGEPIGQAGRLSDQTSLSTLTDLLSAELEGCEEPNRYAFGPETIETAGIVTGAGVEYLEAAADAGLDVLVTGEGKQRAYHLARELGINLVLAGHYATETTGVHRLAEHLETWGLETTYLSHPTGL